MRRAFDARMLALLALATVALGVVALGVKATLYGHVDAEGILHDSVFLPLGALALVAGATLAVAAVRRLAR